MTVRDWIERRTQHVPAALNQRILDMIGGDADAAESRAGELCLAAAARALDALLAEQRFGRDSAVDLLAVDALTTLAFEHASERRGNRDVAAAELRRFAERSAQSLGQLVTQRV